MKTNTTLLTAAAIGVLMALAQLPAAEVKAEVALRAAIEKETVQGDLKGALEQYKKLAQDKDRAVAAKALIRLGEAYEKLGSADAQKQYSLVISKFGDQKDEVAEARARLATPPRDIDSKMFRQTLICSGPDCVGGISPDGKSLVNGIKPNAFVIRDIATMKDRLVEAPTGTRILGALFSPDGSQVAYIPSTAGRAPAPDDPVFVVNRDGSNSHPINVRGADPRAWSPDNKRLLVAVEAADGSVVSLQWVTLSSGAIQKLPMAHQYYTDIKISPDGSSIAFDTTDAGKQRSVRVMASDGSGEIQVAPNPTRQDLVAWTRDGKNLLFRQQAPSGIWAVPILNGKIQGPAVDMHLDLPPDASLLGLDSSGALLFSATSSTSDIYTANLDRITGKVTSVPLPVPLIHTGHNGMPRWSPDSKRLLYHSRLSIAAPAENFVYSFADKNERRVAANTPGASLCWQGDGSSILIVNSTGDTSLTFGGLTRLDWSTGRATSLSRTGDNFTGRSCGGDLVAASMPSTTAPPFGQAIKIRNLSTGTDSELYRPANSMPTLSRDGKLVAFTGRSASGSTVLFVTRTTDAQPKEVVNVSAPGEIEERFYSMSWSADNQYLYYLKRTDPKASYELFRVRATGGSEENLGLRSNELRDIEVSPDGTKIAITMSSSGPQIWAIENFLQKAAKK